MNPTYAMASTRARMRPVLPRRVLRLFLFGPFLFGLFPLGLFPLGLLPSGSTLRAASPSPWDPETGKRAERPLVPIPEAREPIREARAAASPIPRPAPVVALLDFDSTTLDPGVEEAFSQAMWSEFYQTPATRVLPRKEMRRYLIAWDLYPHQPVGPPVALSRTAKALKADYLIHGHINAADGAALLDYRVYSTRLGGILIKDRVIRTTSLQEMVLLVPEISGSILASIDYAERHEAASFREAVASPTQLIEAPATSRTQSSSGPARNPTATAFDPKAQAADAERERVRRAEATFREVRSTPETEKPAATLDAKTASTSTVNPEAVPVRTEVARVSPPPTESAIEPPRVSRVALQPVSQPVTSPSPPSVEAAATPLSVPGTDPPPSKVGDPSGFPKTPIRLTSRTAAREAYEKSRRLPPEDLGSRIALLEQAAILDPLEPDYMKPLALAYYKSARYHDSIAASRKAERLSPRDSIIQTILGSALYETGQLEEARLAHLRAIELDPANLYSRFNLALTLQAQGSPRALAAWEEFLELSEKDPAQAENRFRALEYYDDLKTMSR